MKKVSNFIPLIAGIILAIVAVFLVEILQERVLIGIHTLQLFVLWVVAFVFLIFLIWQGVRY